MKHLVNYLFLFTTILAIGVVVTNEEIRTYVDFSSGKIKNSYIIAGLTYYEAIDHTELSLLIDYENIPTETPRWIICGRETARLNPLCYTSESYITGRLIGDLNNVNYIIETSNLTSKERRELVESILSWIRNKNYSCSPAELFQQKCLANTRLEDNFVFDTRINDNKTLFENYLKTLRGCPVSDNADELSQQGAND